MILGILKEKDENRVALTPKLALKLGSLGVDIHMEKNAGLLAGFVDSDYPDNVNILDRKKTLESSDVLASVNPLSMDDYKEAGKNTLVISMFAPYFDSTFSNQLMAMGLRVGSLDMIPRTTLAQSMDVLSSMASIAGYRAVLLASTHMNKYMPMMITAAGSIRPAKVFILGAGVAGLQAIATARRLGSIVSAFDTRSAVKEEVQSLGAKFVEIEGAIADDKGGYAVEQTEEFLKNQRARVQEIASDSDVVITTAQVRGRKAPELITKETIEKMKPGAVVVDLAASTGGNCALTQNNKTIIHNGVTIIGDSNLAAGMPGDASEMFSNNLVNFMKTMIKEGDLEIDQNNEILASAILNFSK